MGLQNFFSYGHLFSSLSISDLYPFLSNALPAIRTKMIEVAIITAASIINGKSGLILPFSKGKSTCFKASMPYVRGLSFETICRIDGKSLTGYIAPERKNMGITMKFMITLKL